MFTLTIWRVVIRKGVIAKGLMIGQYDLPKLIKAMLDNDARQTWSINKSVKKWKS